jgi:hypothetical protein
MVRAAAMTDGGGDAPQQYTYDPTQMAVVPIEKARVITYVTTNPNGLPSTPQTDYNAVSTAGDEILKKQAAIDAENVAKAKALSPAGIRAALDKIKADEDAAAAAKKAKIESDPDVIAARALVAAAEAEVASTKTYTAGAKTSLELIKEMNAANKPSIYNDDMTPEEIADAATKAAAEAEAAATAAAASTAISGATTATIAESADTAQEEADAAAELAAAEAEAASATDEEAVEVTFSGLSAGEQAAIGAIGEGGLTGAATATPTGSSTSTATVTATGASTSTATVTATGASTSTATVTATQA